MKHLQVDIVVTNTGNPISNGVVSYNEISGEIISISNDPQSIQGPIEVRKGVLVPGYVNAHCHLELSHLKGVIPSGKGLIEFIKGVVQLRDFPEDVIAKAIAKADKEMHEAGIVAVGDISNTADTIPVKSQSSIRYYSFIELFDLFQVDQTAATIQNYKQVYDAYKTSSLPDNSMVPHAPYSVSEKLFEYILGANEAPSTISIHNQELTAENDLFQSMTGGFIDFYKSMGLSLEHFKAPGTNSLDYAMKHMDPAANILLVHNTASTVADIQAAHAWSPNIYWVTCPNANLYIENKLPNYRLFSEQEAAMCIGTDSLSSNWQLSIFDEIKTIKKYQSTIADLELIKWATINGARALGYTDLGTISVGTRPGLNLIDVDVQEGLFDLREARSSSRIV